MQLYPPVSPETQSAEGPQQMQFLAMLAMMRKREPKQFDVLFKNLAKLFTPKEPEPEPMMNLTQLPMRSQAAGLPPPSQPPSGPLGS
jgi:hypothetical protein